MSQPDHASARGDQPPLIVTLALDKTSAKILDDLRKLHFPPHRNFISAHVTLFHNLPSSQTGRIIDDLKTIAASQKQFKMSTAGTQFLGAGVAIRFDAQALLSIRTDLARLWDDWLIPQDRQPYRPHVTIQNKVLPDIARQLAAQIEYYPRMVVQAKGLELWRYCGGPWHYVQRFEFCA